ncbi:hypothetical protein AMECASPLE_021971 [Ameca splendens]|uniref:UBC core domain-containing protein n=1 Tax=Ameca splendens TaxID=208324 RepID=A0ABV0ZZA0_9TELE
MSVHQGFYKGGKFVFSFKVGQGYPHDPPKVKCETMVYHPNIDLEGNVCLNILREDWKPVLTVNSIIYGLQYLFLEPNPEDPLNKEAAEVLQTNRRLFEQNVHRSLRGGYVGATYFERSRLWFCSQEPQRRKAARRNTLSCFNTKEEASPPTPPLPHLSPPISSFSFHISVSVPPFRHHRRTPTNNTHLEGDEDEDGGGLWMDRFGGGVCL